MIASRLIAGAAALALLTGTAAADGPGRWTGFYVGGHAGYAWGEWNGALSYDDADATPLDVPGGHIGPFDGRNRSINGDSPFGGLQVGANYQSGSWVFGLEADVSWTSLSGSGSFLPYPECTIGCPSWAIKTEMDLFGTVRGRLGYTTGPLLLYATGGLAWANVESSIKPIYEGGFVAANGTSEETHFGYTVGGGFEVLLSRNWSLKTEYLFADLGEQNYAYTGKVGDTTLPYDTDHFHPDLHLHTVRFGINYRFD
jgi:outer membrane immunogenic protein